jgi:predicted ATP-grasp superfamily ATP-dependent carboligase
MPPSKTNASQQGLDRVLLTYGWVRSTYAAMRNLAQHGVQVWASDAFRVGMCQWSRHRRGFARYPSHYANEIGFVRAVAQACGEHRIGLVFPSHNETEILARHRALLPAGTDALLPDAQLCALFNNKARSYALAESLGVELPRRIAYSSPAEVPAVFRELDRGSGVVVKLLTGNSAKGVFYPRGAEEAKALVQELVQRFALSPDRLPQIEERVEGFGAGCSVAYWRGTMIQRFSHRRLREKIATGGTSTLRESFRCPAIEEDARRIFDHVGWHGLAMAEFKVCPRTGRSWFIEVNPRMWGSIPLAIAAGAEFPHLLWTCAARGSDEALALARRATIREGWRGRWLLGDMILAASQGAKLQLVEASRTLFRSGADSLDDFHWDDPGAFAGEVAHYLTRFLATRSTNPAEKGMLQ